MGTEATHYVMAAIKLEDPHVVWDNEELRAKMDPHEDNGYRDEVTEIDGITVVSDGMNGQYIMIGQVLAKGVAEHGDGLDLTECECKPSQRRKLAKLIQEKFGITGDVKVWAFTHYH